MQASCHVRSYFIPNSSDAGPPAAGNSFVCPLVLVMGKPCQSRVMSRIVIPKDGRAIVKLVVERIRLQQACYEIGPLSAVHAGGYLGIVLWLAIWRLLHQ